MLINNQSMLT